MRLPFEKELRAERFRLLETLDGLPDDDFHAGPTLCVGWAPRDILAHVIAVDRFFCSYLPYGPLIHAANRAQVARGRTLSREELMESARRWAANPALTSRVGALIVLGDLAIHHQDIRRGLGWPRQVPDQVAAAVLRDGALLSLWTNWRILRYRLVPTDGRGPLLVTVAKDAPEVRGTREALGMWLAGRDAVIPELSFS